MHYKWKQTNPGIVLLGEYDVVLGINLGGGTDRVCEGVYSGDVS